MACLWAFWLIGQFVTGCVCLADWLNVTLTDCLPGLLLATSLLDKLAGQLAGFRAGFLFNLLDIKMTGCLARWLADWLSN